MRARALFPLSVFVGHGAWESRVKACVEGGIT